MRTAPIGHCVFKDRKMKPVFHYDGIIDAVKDIPNWYGIAIMKKQVCICAVVIKSDCSKDSAAFEEAWQSVVNAIPALQIQVKRANEVKVASYDVDSDKSLNDELVENLFQKIKLAAEGGSRV